MKEEIKQKIEHFEELLDSYIVLDKLKGIECKKTIYLYDSVYDSYDYNSPSCYSIKLIYNLYNLKLSVNSDDGDLILEVHDNQDIVKKYLKTLFEKYLFCYNQKDRISVSYSSGFLGYFYNHDEEVEDIIRTYFSYK
jgi:hypothetical protein